MNVVRSILFFAIATVWTIIAAFVGIPLLLSNDRKIVAKIGYFWSKPTIIFMRLICGVRVKVVGTSNLPKTGAIIACKHQSPWETIFFLSYLNKPSYVLKKELTRIPFYGWYLKPMGMICIDRASKISALKETIKGVQKACNDGRKIIIFPEGTRVAHGQSVAYKAGIAAIHHQLPNIPIIPTALNSGKIWPGKSWIIKPGLITVKFLSPIQQQLNKTEILHLLKTRIDSESGKLHHL